MALCIIGKPTKKCWIISRAPECDIAILAKKPANLLGCVTVIDMKGFSGAKARAATSSANPSLRRQQGVITGLVDPIATPDTLLPDTRWIGLFARMIVGTQARLAVCLQSVFSAGLPPKFRKWLDAIAHVANFLHDIEYTGIHRRAKVKR